MPQYTHYREARNRIQDGYILILNRPGLISWGTLGKASHVMIAKWVESDYGDTLGVVEAREGKNIRWVTLSSQVRDFPGMIDVYRPQCSSLLMGKAASVALNQCGKRYAYRDLLRLAGLTSHLVRYWFGMAPRDPQEQVGWHDDKFCSMLADWVFKRAKYELGSGEKFELVPNKHPSEVSPANVEQSGSLVPMYQRLVPKGWRAAA